MKDQKLAEVSLYYINEDDRDYKLKLACQLAIKAYKVREKVFVLAANQSDAQRIDNMMWDFTNSFIPHVISQKQTNPPHLIRIGTELPDDSQYLLINLTDDYIALQGLTDRLFEIATPLEKVRLLGHKEHYETLECVVNEFPITKPK